MGPAAVAAGALATAGAASLAASTVAGVAAIADSTEAAIANELASRLLTQAKAAMQLAGQAHDLIGAGIR